MAYWKEFFSCVLILVVICQGTGNQENSTTNEVNEERMNHIILNISGIEKGQVTDLDFMNCTGECNDNGTDTELFKFSDLFLSHKGFAGLVFTVGNVISMLELLVTIFTFSLFPTLRKGHGKYVLNLSIGLLFAKLAFQINPFFTDQNYICSMFATIQHYFCLVAFLWVSVLAYELFESTRMGTSHQQTSFGFYLMYAWGLPFSLVVACLVVETLTSFEFKYGNPEHCGVMGDEALMYSLAVPLVAITVINMAIFVRTLICLYLLSPPPASVRQNMTEESLQKLKIWVTYTRMRLWAYFKMSLVMATAWLCGLLAAYFEFWELWLIFVICNSLQGICIFGAFVWKKHVFHLYAVKFGFSKAKKYEKFENEEDERPIHFINVQGDNQPNEGTHITSELNQSTQI